MASTVYNKFIKEVENNNINLELPNTYRMALLKSYPNDVEPQADDSYNFQDMMSHECVDDYHDEDEGYQSKGKYIQLNKIDTDRNDNIIEYTSEGVEWNNITLDENNNAVYAIIFRESDNLLISCYKFNNPIELEDDTLKLSWYSIPILSFWISTTQGTPTGVDDHFDKESSNSLMNKVVTKGFIDYGVAIGDKTIIESLEGMDTLTAITDDYINNLFK